MPINFRLYLITDRQLCPDQNVLPLIDEVCAAGIKAIQLREKDLSAREMFRMATDLKKICAAAQSKLLINDRADIAEGVGADGVHLTSRSMPVPVVRSVLTSPKVIGVSIHSLAEAVQAQAEGADFAVFGPVFDTPSKRAYGPPQGLEKLSEVVQSVTIPVFAVGGIDPQGALKCRECGAWGVAVISSIISADNVRERILEFEQALGGV